MDSRLTKALQLPVDYSSDFSEKVQKLRDQISDALGVEGGLDPDMNYRAGQRIVVRFNEQVEPVGLHDSSGVFELSVFVTSRGSYYTYVLRRLEKPSFDFAKLDLPQPKEVWNTVAPQVKEWPKAAMTAVDSVMARNSYLRLEGPVLSRIVEGKYTDMDGKPATVFEVLFSEID